jgi:hypothetical protein
LNKLSSFFSIHLHRLVFLLFVTVSLIVLPSISQREVYPFFDWRLFAQVGGDSLAFDLVILQQDGSETLLSDFKIGNKFLRVPLWRRAQALGNILLQNSSSPPSKNTREMIDGLRQSLTENGLKPVRLVKIKIPFHRYVAGNLTSGDKLAAVDAMYVF